MWKYAPYINLDWLLKWYNLCFWSKLFECNAQSKVFSYVKDTISEHQFGFSKTSNRNKFIHLCLLYNWGLCKGIWGSIEVHKLRRSFVLIWFKSYFFNVCLFRSYLTYYLDYIVSMHKALCCSSQFLIKKIKISWNVI